MTTTSTLTHAQYVTIQEHLAGTTGFGGLRLDDADLVANYATTPTDPVSRTAIDQARDLYPFTVTQRYYTAMQLQAAIRQLTAPSTTKTGILIYILAPLPSGAGLEVRVADGTAATYSPDGPSLLAQMAPSVPVIIAEGPAPVAA